MADNITDILDFITQNNKTIIISVTTICEVIVIIFNMARRIIAREENFKLQSIDTLPERSVKNLFIKDIVWSINPINVFRSAHHKL